VAEVGMSKPRGGGEFSGSHNKPIGCGASGAYAPGTDNEEEQLYGTTQKAEITDNTVVAPPRLFF